MYVSFYMGNLHVSYILPVVYFMFDSTYTADIGITQNLEVDLYVRSICTSQFTIC